jgi:hypothetical protein
MRLAPRSEWHAYLTDEERRHPLARYWYRTAPIADDVLTALRAGPIDPFKALAWEDRRRLSEPGDLPLENGWCHLPDGAGFVAVRTRFPGSTAAMIDWWFEWAQRDEIIRYKIWCPGAHYSMAQEPTPGVVRRSGGKPYWGMTRYPVEDVGRGAERLRLDFHDPRDFGFDGEPEGGTILCARVGLPNGWLKHSEFIHHVRPIDGGVEMRSRFWMARRPTGPLAFVAGAAPVKRRLLGRHAARELAFHCAQEFSQLASFLPELHAAYA